MYYANVNYFNPNPWQPRTRMDTTALQELADNIHSLKGTRPKTKGLLHLPSARLVDINGDICPAMLIKQRWDGPGMLEGDDITPWLEGCGYRIQIGIGHRRHAAFLGLAVNDPDYALLPFELTDFTDEEMFKIALSENVARADLNPIEIATSMLRYRDEFGKSSKEIGDLFGYSDSAVRNMLRLLDLPDEPRQALAEGRMSQGAGRQLLRLYALPESVTKARFWRAGDWLGKAQIEAYACMGGMASEIEEMINTLIKQTATDLSTARWKHTDIFPEIEDIHHPDCSSCPARMVMGKANFCLVPACYRAKRAHWEGEYLQQAGKASDIPPFEGSVERATTFDWSSYQPVLTEAYARRCPNLCVRFNGASLERNGQGYEKITVPGFPGAEMICKKMNQHCTCLQAHNAGVSLTPTQNGYETEPTPDPTPATLTEADLKATRQEISEQKRQHREQSKAIRAEVERQVRSTLGLFNLQAWKLVAKKLRYDCGREAKTWDELTAAIAAQLVADAFEFLNLDELERNQRKAGEVLEGLGIKPVSTETPSEK